MRLLFSLPKNGCCLRVPNLAASPPRPNRSPSAKRRIVLPNVHSASASSHISPTSRPKLPPTKLPRSTAASRFKKSLKSSVPRTTRCVRKSRYGRKSLPRLSATSSRRRPMVDVSPASHRAQSRDPDAKLRLTKGHQLHPEEAYSSYLVQRVNVIERGVLVESDSLMRRRRRLQRKLFHPVPNSKQYQCLSDGSQSHLLPPLLRLVQRSSPKLLSLM